MLRLADPPSHPPHFPSTFYHPDSPMSAQTHSIPSQPLASPEGQANKQTHANRKLDKARSNTREIDSGLHHIHHLTPTTPSCPNMYRLHIHKSIAKPYRLSTNHTTSLQS